MKIVMEIGKFEHGTFTPRGKEGQPDAAETWVRLVGRPVPEQGAEAMDARWLRTISYGPVADALKAKINEVTFDGDKVGSLRLIVDLEGEWKTRVQKSETGEKEVRSFVVSKFDLRTGPSVELSRLRRDADVKLAEAAATVEAGDLSSAYRALEAFVAGIALRGPVIGNEAQVSIQDGPEERALKAFAKADGKDLSATRKEDAPAATMTEPPAPASAGTGPIEAPLDEPSPQEAKPAEETQAPAVEEKVVEEKAAEPAPPAPKSPPPRPPMAPRMPMPRRPPPPPPSGLKPR